MRKFNVLAVLLLITLLVTGCVASLAEHGEQPKVTGRLVQCGARVCSGGRTENRME